VYPDGEPIGGEPGFNKMGELKFSSPLNLTLEIHAFGEPKAFLGSRANPDPPGTRRAGAAARTFQGPPLPARARPSPLVPVPRPRPSPRARRGCSRERRQHPPGCGERKAGEERPPHARKPPAGGPQSPLQSLEIHPV
jgi:hypothetical protein